MNLKENYKGVFFIWHSIHNEFVIFITNTYYNGFMDKRREKLRPISQLMLTVSKVKPTHVSIT